MCSSDLPLSGRDRRGQRGEEVRLEVMSTGPIDVDDGEGEVIQSHGKSCGNREFINNMVGQLQKAVIPSRDDPSRGASGRRRW